MTDTLYNGDSYHDQKRNAMYYRGDGANTSVVLPDGKRVDMVKPFHPYHFEVNENGWSIVTFNPAIENGVLVKIALKDNL